MTASFTFDRFAAENLADPYGLYRRVREEQPVFYADAFDVWVVSRYEDVRRVLMDPTRFSSAFQIRTPHAPAPGVTEILAAGHPEVPALLNEDPPAHRRTRDLVAKTFTPRRIAVLEPQITAIVGELLDAMEPRGHADLVTDLATPLPLRVICELIGFPAEDAADRAVDAAAGDAHLVRRLGGGAAGDGARVGRVRALPGRGRGGPPGGGAGRPAERPDPGARRRRGAADRPGDHQPADHAGLRRPRDDGEPHRATR